ncbi:LysR family transcriptional regulator [Ensifer sp. ENS09]|uniref:LysR substrate-binding domain-containing protein n=1 Tax=Ensifer sp. ENS09 TaxID=2769263 RepID=UPI00178638E9|nr:LysR substrate-binding domain-containing protein [Ensifer sp. ENS09]MBD9649380.1 LysR family transcriptional regulator [Ensifer sp. ENS09]
MNGQPFDLDLLRAFATVADCGGFTAAAGRLNSTQSTVSQKVLRLEEQAGHRLLERSHRQVRLTEAGEQLIGYARRMLALDAEARQLLSGASVAATLRLGLPEDFAAGRTTRMLSAFARRYDNVRLEVTSGLSRELRSLYDRSELDIVVVKQRRGSGEAVQRWQETLCWIDSADHPVLALDPLPLVVFPPRGLYRDDMVAALDASGRRWRVSYTSSSLASIQSAVADGLGISLLPARVVHDGHRVVKPQDGLPMVETMEIGLYYRPEAGALVTRLAEDLSALIGDDSRDEA